MRRLPITLTLTALAGLTLATSALAAPDRTDVADCPMADDATMEQMHDDADAMVDRHDHMLAMHPEMAVHMEEVGLDPTQMREWLAEGLDHDELHQRLDDAGVDVEAMHETCPMADGAMPHDGTMPHVDGAHHGGADPGHDPGGSHPDLHDRHHS